MIRVVRLGTPRAPDEGLRLGTVRRPPRGVRKADYARRDYFELTDARWRTYARRYRAEMQRPAPQRLLGLLAGLSSRADFSVGCYCEDESRCHRSLLQELLVEAGATVERR